MKNNRQKYEINDLILLHSWFEAGDNNFSDMQEIKYHLIRIDKKKYMWSDVIKITSDYNNEDQYNSMYAKIKNSDLIEEVKQWWMVILAIMMNAPLSQLDSLAKGKKYMPDKVSKECVCVASRIFANIAAEEERVRREKQRKHEEEQLKRSEKEVAEKQQQKEIAEDNLHRHRSQQ